MSGILNSTLSSNATSAGVNRTAGQSAGAFASSLTTAIVVFSIQALVFLLIKDRFARIYQPRTYLVPVRERTDPAAPGWFKWIKTVLSTGNAEFVQKCGLDAYFFLRYLRMLLKIFVPAAIVIIPILIPLNAVGGKGSDWALTHSDSANVTGLDQLAWGNVRPANYRRYWGHWTLALCLIVYVCYIAFDELRNYIRMRQAYITSPQHRLRASATTVLVSSIPEKWCTVEALDGLYDVFPGGLRNIWINRNFDELNEKVSRRDKLALTLEGAETDLIKKCSKKNEEKIAKERKLAGKKLTKAERKQKEADQDENGRRKAQGHGLSFGNPHQIKHTLDAVLGNSGDHESTSSEDEKEERTAPANRDKRLLPIPVVGDGLQVVTHGLGKIGKQVIGGMRGVNINKAVTIDQNPDNTSETPLTPDQPYSPGIPKAEWSGQSPTDGNHHRNEKTFGTPKKATHAHDASAGARRDDDGAFDQTRFGGQLDSDQDRLHQPGHTSAMSDAEKGQNNKPPPTVWQKAKNLVGLGEKEEKEPVDYAKAFNKQFDNDDEDAVWRKYIEEKDRDTMRLPIRGWQWMPSLPLVGEKVDTIYYCRREVARLNTEIEDDQAHPERFPLMNSAFIQFNHQVAAHMACQAVSHHLPKQMAPRIVEIDPSDVIWDNMSVPWWQAYIRTAFVVAVVTGMVALWAIPVAFTSALSQLNQAAKSYPWLSWILDLPRSFVTIVQGVLPTILLALLTFLLPMILRFLARLEGIQSGMLVELTVQRYYFFFLFVQLFLVVTVASSTVTFLASSNAVNVFTNIPNLLGQNIPKASNYFFSYMLLQALSVSSGALVQIGTLIGWFILAPIFDSTARAKFKRQTSLSDIQWGTFFPVYTNLACIGLIYSVVSPLILIFNVITFSLFWFVYRYNTLYVTKFTRDTGGLLYPNAINYTFVGIYISEVALIGLFFLVRGPNDDVVCSGQAIGMIIILILTAGYQILLNNAFSPLFRYLPITLEDDAVRRDEEFARALRNRHSRLIDDEREDEDIEDQLEAKERRSLDEDREAQEYEMQRIAASRPRDPGQIQTNEEPELAPYEFQNPEVSMDLNRESKGMRVTRNLTKKVANAAHLPQRRTTKRKSSWADRDNVHNRRSTHFGEQYSPDRHRPHGVDAGESGPAKSHLQRRKQSKSVLDQVNNLNPLLGGEKDMEAQRNARAQLSEALFGGVSDELEDLTPEQRDALVQRAFQHTALRARRPVIWIPRDELGVSDDEVQRMGKFSASLWVSNVRQGLDGKGRAVYSGAPPDFSEVDLIQL